MYTALFMKNSQKTPFFPSWRPRLAPMAARLANATSQIRRFTLGQLETHFSPCLPNTLFPKARTKANSRDRLYTQPLTFWSFLWQCFNPGAPCREVVRQVQFLFALLDRKGISGDDGVYCKARQRLSQPALVKALGSSAKAAQDRAPKTGFLKGRPVRVVDGAMLTLSDTKANQKKYPKMKNGYHQIGFPQMRLVVLFCLASGAILARVTGNKHASESRLFGRLMGSLNAGDIVIADQGFGNFTMVSLLRELGVDFIARSSRDIDCRQGSRLGHKDRLVSWKKSRKCSAILTRKHWKALPQEQTVRVIRGRIAQKGFRVRQMTLVTTLLDAKKYPSSEILRAYLRRWRLEMCLDDLKTTMKIEQLRCKTPTMAEKELLVHLIAHNLIRWLMAEVGRCHDVDIERISFKGTLDAFRQFSHAISQVRSARGRRVLWVELLKILAEDLVPDRPGRREPRAVKRRHHKYPPLNKPRTIFRDRIKRNERRSRKRLRTRA
jgi:hypothetical protein